MILGSIQSLVSPWSKTTEEFIFIVITLADEVSSSRDKGYWKFCMALEASYKYYLKRGR